LLLGSAHVVISVIIHSGIVFGAARAGALVARMGDTIVLRRGMAIAIGLIAIWLAWSTRSG
jgi:hypothetical protein